MLRPVGKNILVKIKPEEKKTTLILTNANDKPFQAIVVDKGATACEEINKDEVVLLVPYCGSKISTEDDGYLLITERDILGVIV